MLGSSLYSQPFLLLRVGSPLCLAGLLDIERFGVRRAGAPQQTGKEDLATLEEVGGGGDALVPAQCYPPAYQGCSAEH